MSVVKIIKVPNKKLKMVCEVVTDFGPETKKLAQNLLDTLHAAKNPEGAGLAAPQIDVLKRICVVRRFTTDKDNPDVINMIDHLLINPRVIKESKERDVGWEACLSIPDVYAQVDRAKKIKVESQDENGNKKIINASGFFARVMQHEIDHLNGILITDKNIGKIINEEQFDRLTQSYDL